MTIRVRFAPSPTGFLHIGGARTALFNYLFARHHGGTFLLRVEDTDRARSTQAAIDAIFDGLDWLGLSPDEAPAMQSANQERHGEVVEQLLASGHAYRCYTTAEELEAEREAAKARGEVWRYNRRWRDASPEDAPAGVTPSIRLKAPLTGEVTIDDAVQGATSVACSELDDMVLMRADGTPTYQLAVVVDDHDMGITHVIRGDDHFTNSFRQALIYQALGWDVPAMAHVPLIHGPDGAKLSKRHGALGVEAYREMGYLPEALCNYLLRLGWSHGDEEIIPWEQAIAWFDLDGLGASPARFDMDKLDHLNAHYMREADATRLYALAKPVVEAHLGRTLDTAEDARLQTATPELQQRATTVQALAESALFLFRLPETFTAKAQKQLAGNEALFRDLHTMLAGIEDWSSERLHEAAQHYAEANTLKLGKLMNPLRAAITGSHASPSMFEVMPWLGKDECLRRIARQCG